MPRDIDLSELQPERRAPCRHASALRDATVWVTSACRVEAMGVEWSAQNQATLDEIDNGLKRAETEATVTSRGIQLFRFGCGEGGPPGNPEWTFVSASALPRFYNENEDAPSKTVRWRLEVEAGNIDADVSHNLELLGDRRERRTTFRSGAVWALKFPDARSYLEFWNDYNNKLFENLYGAVNTRANREEHLGRDFASQLFAEENAEMEWEDAVEDIKQEDATPNKSAADALSGEGEISLIKLGIGESSYSVRGDRVTAMRNVPSGVEDKGQEFSFRRAAGEAVKPNVVMLADQERRMGMLSDIEPEKLLYADVETGKIVQEWNFERDDVQIPMTEIVPETKSAPAETRSTFLSYDKNRLCRWDMRDPSGMVQVYNPMLDYLGGKDYARYTNFTCMATAGDGSVVVGSHDGKIRLYSNKLTLKRASTAFPGIGTPITHIDVTFDGRWVIATTDHFIEVIKTTGTDEFGKQIDGFRKSLGSHAIKPKLLKLKPEDMVRTEHAPLKKGRFTFVTEANHQERWIVATCGKFSVLWNFRQMKASTGGHVLPGGLRTFTTYHLVSKDEPVVDSCFLHETHEEGNQSEAALVVATSKKVWSFNE